MGFFEDDGFGIEDFFKNITNAGNIDSMENNRKKYTNKSSNNVTNMPENQVITEKNIFLIFDFSKFKEIHVEIGDEKDINDYNEEFLTGRKSLEISNDDKIIERYTIPKEINDKELKWTFNNGILEVIFKRWKMKKWLLR